MNASKPKKTPHLDPLPFGRGEESGEGAAISQEMLLEPKAPFLSPSRGEDQGEGSRRTTIQRGRKLRKNSTWAEKILWRHLRNRQFAGYKFRRQHDFGPYTLDFYCAKAHLSIELDGREHGHPERQSSDAQRTAFLATRGIKEIRFWNFLVRENLRAVLDTVLRELSERIPHLDPLPFRKGEESGESAAISQVHLVKAKMPFLSPQRGEDQGEGSGKETEPRNQSQRKPLLKFTGPRNEPTK